MNDFIKTILNTIQSWTKKEIKNSASDWNQNDVNANGYVKNRTHWEEEGRIYNLDKKKYTFPHEITRKDSATGTTYELCATNPEESIKLNIPIEKGQEYIVYFDGKEYKLKCEETEGSLYLGWDYYGEITNEHEFGICCNFDGSELLYIFTYRSDTNQHTVAVYRIGTVIHKLDSKYLNLPTNLATTDDVQGALDLANKAQSTANKAQSAADAKMSAANPVGTGSFSMNRKSGSVIGDNSHAEGRDATASGYISHAEGYGTTASASFSHVEGTGTIANGNQSHVQGGYNISDASPTDTATGRRKYAHIVGNGTSDTARSNAYTLDWDGNAWYSGDVYVGSASGTDKDEGSKKLATEEFVSSKIAEAELGGEEVDLSGYALKSELPSRVSQLQNDSGYITDYTETDPTVPAWAKAASKPTYTASEVGARPSNWMPTAADVGADSKGTASSAVSAHNTATDAHNDIRLALKDINDRLNAFFDSDDKTLDELSEIVTYITSNKALIDSITTSKVSVSDIINNLTTNVSNKPLSAAQGVVLKGLIDTLNSGKLDASALSAAINTALAQAKASGEFDGKDGATGATGATGVGIKSITIQEVS